MREIGYRAWLKEEKKYVYPTLILVSFGVVTGIAYTDIDEITHQPIERRLIIEDVVLEQATDLRDRNDKMIYEGDFIKYPDEFGNYLVSFEDGGFYPFIKDLREFRPEYFEITGNINENPELFGE
jgi:uncharacterized phage protein (TIGR01671 family)